MKKLLLSLIVYATLILPISSFAQQSNDFAIIPAASSGGAVEKAVNAVGASGGNVRNSYNTQAGKLTSVGDQLASGIMTRDTLLEYVVYLVRFLSQIGLLIGVLMIIYAGYLYASSIFNPGNMGKGKSAIGNAIVGVLVIAFSYAIMKLLTSAFLS
ncbi:MAG: hypothetical protein NTY80_04465 [candidate division SR1 bacterium]|nr:hypothetical protein [candidate division SR1 bacterium]